MNSPETQEIVNLAYELVEAIEIGDRDLQVKLEARWATAIRRFEDSVVTLRNRELSRSM